MRDAMQSIPVSYRREWQDGFGARGWKLDVSIDEPSVIAATAEHGMRVPTSVLVHDILDHHLCGFGIGGHRNEAMPLLQLASRTGADPRVDFRQIVDEDLMQGHCNGEPLLAFLPDDLVALVPAQARDGKSVIGFLRNALGEDALRERLVEHFVAIGESVQQRVKARWRYMGLEYQRRASMGLALQQLLVRVDEYAHEEDWEQAHGRFLVGNEVCAVVMDGPKAMDLAVSFN
ncbi:MAG: hypothetical protein ABR544_03465 [Gammaproteobacteria bacterium]